MDTSEYLIKNLKYTNMDANNLNCDFLNENPEENETDLSNQTPSLNLIINLVENIKKESEIDKALYELSKQREKYEDMALYIYYSTGTMGIL